jgi:hypothetical protein
MLPFHTFAIRRAHQRLVSFRKELSLVPPGKEAEHGVVKTRIERNTRLFINQKHIGLIPIAAATAQCESAHPTVRLVSICRTAAGSRRALSNCRVTPRFLQAMRASAGGSTKSPSRREPIENRDLNFSIPTLAFINSRTLTGSRDLPGYV